MLIKRGLFFVILLMTALSVSAQTWPNRPIRVVIPVAAGSGPDTVMRVLSEHISTELGQSVIVDPRPGAGGIAAFQNFKSSRDDHTFLFVITSTAMAQYILKAASSIDIFRDTQAVVQIAESPVMIVANPKVGAKNLADMLRMAKERPGKMSVATPVPRSLANLAAELLQQLGDVKLNIVPFTKASEAMSATIGGDVDFSIDAISAQLPFVKSGRMVPIAVLASSRLPGLEAYPIGRDTLPGLEVLGNYGLVGQKELSKTNAQMVAKAFANALADPAIIEKMKDLGLYGKAGTPEAYEAALKRESEQWRNVIRNAGLFAE